jgi:hypothetical protein
MGDNRSANDTMPTLIGALEPALEQKFTSCLAAVAENSILR